MYITFPLISQGISCTCFGVISRNRPGVSFFFAYFGEIVNLLIEHGAYINAVHPFYGTVLFIGGYQENYNIVKVALQYKAEIKISQFAENECPDPPTKANSHAVTMMFVAGEYFPFHLYPDEDIAKAIVRSQDDLSLKNLCHRAIRYYIIMSGNNQNLFEAANRLQLPRLLQNYILYGMSLFDDTDDSEEFES